MSERAPQPSLNFELHQETAVTTITGKLRHLLHPTMSPDAVEAAVAPDLTRIISEELVGVPAHVRDSIVHSVIERLKLLVGPDEFVEGNYR